VDAPETFFPYEAWRSEAGLNYLKEVHDLSNSLPDKKDEAKLQTYLRLAQILLAQGDAAEAIGYLDNIKRTNPQFFVDHKVSAMLGAAHFLMARYGEASQAFSVPELKEEVEL